MQEKCLRNGVERRITGFSECIDAILNWIQPNWTGRVNEKGHLNTPMLKAFRLFDMGRQQR